MFTSRDIQKGRLVSTETRADCRTRLDCRRRLRPWPARLRTKRPNSPAKSGLFHIPRYRQVIVRCRLRANVKKPFFLLDAFIPKRVYIYWSKLLPKARALFLLIGS